MVFSLRIFTEHKNSALPYIENQRKAHRFYGGAVVTPDNDPFIRVITVEFYRTRVKWLCIVTVETHEDGATTVEAKHHRMADALYLALHDAGIQLSHDECGNDIYDSFNWVSLDDIHTFGRM